MANNAAITSCEVKADSVGELFLRQHRADLKLRLDKIEHCLNQLDEADLWWRPHQSHNAMGNIVLHLCGNLRQWAINGVTGAPDTRDRPAEFAQRDPIAKAELIRMLRATVEQADAVLASLSADDLLQPRRVQGFESTVQAVIQDTVSHFGGHTQEIIWITRLRLGDRYAFMWTPADEEQGA